LKNCNPSCPLYIGKEKVRLGTTKQNKPGRGDCRLYHKPFEQLNRLAIDHNHQTTRSKYARTSTAWDTNKNWLISFLVTKYFQLNSMIRN